MGCCDSEPGLLKKTYSFVRALANWRLKGSPKRSPDEVLHILETHCKPCDKYQIDEDSPKLQANCLVCGCYVNDLDDARGNKIVMKTENCPLGRW